MDLSHINPLYIILLAVWTLPWKGVALWRAARLRDQKWFLILLIVNTLGILEIVYIFLLSKKKYAALKEKDAHEEQPKVAGGQ